eukprot:GGOE01006421.1.p1 GENE.GGOE01006421.1~~GGOE01006421.1.p1  ORF type:complete len:929 (-),score=156.15 GGOE01006421.1:358-3144(-)
MDTPYTFATQSSCYAVEFQDNSQGDSDSDFVIAPVCPEWVYFFSDSWQRFDEGLSKKLEDAWRGHNAECEVQIEREMWIVYMPKLFARKRLHTATCIAIHRNEEDHLAPGVSWVYQDALMKEWVHFRAAVSEVIESAFQLHQPSINILVLGDEWFSVLFKYNLALNKHGRYRHVRRCQVSVGFEIFLSTPRPKWIGLEGFTISEPDSNPDRQEIEFEDGVLDLEKMCYFHAHGDIYGVRRCWVDLQSLEIVEEEKQKAKVKPKASRRREHQVSTIFEEEPLPPVFPEPMGQEEGSIHDTIHRRPKGFHGIPKQFSPSQTLVQQMPREPASKLDCFHVESRAERRSKISDTSSLPEMPEEDSLRSVDSFHVHPRSTPRGALLSPSDRMSSDGSQSTLLQQSSLQQLLSREASSSSEDFRLNPRPKTKVGRPQVNSKLQMPLLSEAPSLDDESSPKQRPSYPRIVRTPQPMEELAAASSDPMLKSSEWSGPETPTSRRKVPTKGIPFISGQIPLPDQAPVNGDHHRSNPREFDVDTTNDGWFMFPKSVWEAAPQGVRMQMLEDVALHASWSEADEEDTTPNTSCASSMCTILPNPAELEGRGARATPPRAVPLTNHTAADGAPGVPAEEEVVLLEPAALDDGTSMERAEGEECEVTSIESHETGHADDELRDDAESRDAQETFGHEEGEAEDMAEHVEGTTNDDEEDVADGTGEDAEDMEHSESLVFSVEAPEGQQIFHESWSSSSFNTDPSNRLRANSTDSGARNPAKRWNHVKPRIDANNLQHRPGGGNVVIPRKKVDWSNVRPRIDANNLRHVPGGGSVAIVNVPLKWDVKARVDHDNKKHKPGGGNVKIINETVHWEAEPMVPRARQLAPKSSDLRRVSKSSEDSGSGSDSCRSAPPDVLSARLENMMPTDARSRTLPPSTTKQSP